MEFGGNADAARVHRSEGLLLYHGSFFVAQHRVPTDSAGTGNAGRQGMAEAGFSAWR
jgi:hypothetical protein